MSDVEPAADHRHPKHNHSRSEVGGDGCGGIGGGTVVDAYGGLAQDDGGGSGLGGGGCMGGNDDEDDDRNTGNAGSSSGQCCMNTTLQIVLSTPGLVVLVVAYSVMGALIFPVLEAPVEQQPVVAVVTNSREECLKELWTITERLNVLYERNWTMLVHEQLRRFEGTIVAATRGGLIETAADAQPRWTFSEALLYSVTVITTIGHGNLTPRTSEGKVVTMLYALVGVPLMLMCLSSLGGFLAEALQCSYGRLCGGGGRSDSGHDNDGGNKNGSSMMRKPNNAGGGDGTKMIEQHHIKHGDDNELNCNMCSQYDAVYRKDNGAAYENERDDSCCLIRQSPAKAVTASAPSPSVSGYHHNHRSSLVLNNINATSHPSQHHYQLQQQQPPPPPPMMCNNSTLPRGKHNNTQQHYQLQPSQPNLDPSVDPRSNTNSTVYFTLNRMQMTNAQLLPPPPHQYHQQQQQQQQQQHPPVSILRPTLVHCQHPSSTLSVVALTPTHIPPPASFATQQPTLPRYALLQQMGAVGGDGGGGSGPHNNCHATATAAMQLPSNFENNEYRVVQQHPMPMSMPAATTTSPMHLHQQQQQQQQQHQQQHHTATVHGLGRSKFLPKPMPPEINHILLSDASVSSSSTACGHNDATETTTTAGEPAEMMSLKGGCSGGAGATMSSMETLDDDDDEDVRIGCQHGTPSRIPLIRQRSAKLAHSKAASKLDEATVNPISPNAAATVDQLSILSYNQHQHSPQVPITIILIILIGYIAIGTVIFALWENWSIVDGAYFCFVTLSTIGFGDLMPTKTFHGPEIQLFACCVYLVLGLVLVAMSFSLLETQLLWKCRRMAVRLKLTAD